MAISHVTDKIVAGKESVAYGTIASSFLLNLGDVESFSYTENNNAEALNTVGSGHTAHRTEAGLYYVTGTLTTRMTKSSVENLLEATLGDVDVLAGTYTAITKPDVGSYTVKAQHNTTKTAQITGLVFTTFTIEASTNGYMTLSADYVAQKLTLATETITPVLATDDVFVWLDVCGKWRTVNINATSYSINGDWNVSPEEGRGLECVSVGSRRLIQRVIRNNLTITGDVDYRKDDTFESFGYTDEMTSGTLELTASRGTDNAHTFKIINAIENTNEGNNDAEATVKEMTLSITGTDVEVTGDSNESVS